MSFDIYCYRKMRNRLLYILRKIKKEMMEWVRKNGIHGKERWHF